MRVPEGGDALPDVASPAFRPFTPTLMRTMPIPATHLTRSTSATPARTVLTFVTPNEQHRIDAAGQGVWTTVHRDSLEQVLAELRARPATAVVVSAVRYQHHHANTVARMVREFPCVPAVALLTATEVRATQAVLALGHHGVRTLVDARDAGGWRDLRHLVTREDPSAIEAQARVRLHEDLRGAHAACLKFIDVLFGAAPFTTVRSLARALEVHPTTLMSRFFRAGLPPAKRYVAYARLTRAARLLESPGVSITQAAFQLEFSSPQSFSRHVQSVMHIGSLDFRQRYTGASMLEEFRQQLVLPHREALLRFDPMSSPLAWRSPLRMVAERPAAARRA